MVDRRYGKVSSGSGTPSGPPRGQQRRDGVIAVAAKRPMEEPVSRPAHHNGRDPQIDELQLPGYPAAHSPQGSCCFCGNTEKEGVLVPAPMSSNPEYKSGVMVCDQCTDHLIDAVRSELPRRRLRLAMERMMAGPIDAATVEAVEKMAGGAREPE